MRLGILDQSPIMSGSTAQAALQQSLQLAEFADARGYHRYWFAEHHGSDSFAGCAPEVMIGQALARTRSIRVGSGGVMLMHYSPLKIAETFNVLQSLFPDRVDLGIGRAPGSDSLTAAALAYGSRIGTEYIPAKLADLAAFLESRTPHTEALQAVRSRPQTARPTPVWMLGSTLDGAQLAAQFGLPYCHAHFIGPENTRPASASYLDGFRNNDKLSGLVGTRRPYLALGVFVICADTESEAQVLARCRDLWRVRAERGEFSPFPTLAEAQDYRFSAAEQARIAERREHMIAGTADQIAEKLQTLAKETLAQELMLVCITPDFQSRLHSYELIADAMLPNAP
ncbi:MAG: LLM class flavin-dependent oxidoreductase [Pseudomonadales bacterium]